MVECEHRRLVMIQERKVKFRCRHCHLVLAGDELGQGYCPECYEVHHVKRYDFDRLEPEESGKIRYRCEDCGAIIEDE
ncbi:MAG: hypothetical protein ACLFVT_06765 [Syntrophobacteria bacterium]